MEITRLTMFIFTIMNIWVLSLAADSGGGCGTIVVTLAPCLDFINDKSASKPSSECCTQISKTEPNCMCQLLNGGNSNINKNQTTSLLEACNVKPPQEKCSVSPSSSPAGSFAMPPSSELDGLLKNSTLSPSQKDGNISSLVQSLDSGSGCSTVVITLAPCLDFVHDKSKSKSSKPSPDCCTQMTETTKTKPQCICQLLNGDNENIDKEQTTSLLDSCEVKAPTQDECAKAKDSPSGSPSRSSDTSPSSQSDEPTDDTTPSDKNGGNMTNSPMNIILALFFILLHFLAHN